MPPKLTAWSTAWQRLHPKWEMRVWHECKDGVIEANGVQFTSQYPELLARSCHLSQRSNIWRYELVNQFGGVYLDTDMEPLRPIDGLLANVQAFTSLIVSARGNKSRVCSGCSVFGSIAKHPWMSDLVAQLKTRDVAINGSLDSPYLTMMSTDHPEVTRFEPGVFSAHNKVSGGYAIHHWSSRWWPGSFKQLGATS